MTRRPRARLRVLLVVAVLAAALALLALTGDRLPGPVLAVARGPRLRWAGATDPASVIIGVVHALATAVATYLLCAAVLEVTTQLCACHPGGSDRGSGPRVPWASAMVRRAAGVGLAVSVGAGAALASNAAAATVAPTVVMHLDEPAAAPVMHLVTRSTAPVPRATATPRAARATRATRSRRSGAIRPPTVWTIRPGDHLWKVAGLTLARARGRPAADATILAYVDEIVRANQHVFVVPGQPDLVYPGQRFLLPPPPVT